MSGEVLSALKKAIHDIGRKYPDRFERARRLFIEERAKALGSHRDAEYNIKSQIAKFFEIAYSSVSFAGSAQLGFSIHKDKPFALATSDLDVACIEGSLFERAWADVISTSRAFTDLTKFSGLKAREIDLFKDSILRRGMIRIELMPRSPMSARWQQFEERLSRDNSLIFGKVSIAIYMSEYAFCWKQDSALVDFLARWGSDAK